MNELALFAGAGGGILGGKILGWRTRCAVEIDTFARRVLLARQQDGTLEPFPIWDDVKTFDGYQWRGHIDLISGGFPCQDISSAGTRKGLAGARSGLWFEFARIIYEVRPKHVFIENSHMLRTNGLDQILTDLARLGFDAKWGVLGGNTVGAPHLRQRMWIVAHAHGIDGQEGGTLGNVSLWPEAQWGKDAQEHVRRFFALRNAFPRTPRVANGVANRLDRLKAIGNGQIPAVAALAWETLK